MPVIIGQALTKGSMLRHYTAAGHVLGFLEDGVIIASGTHALRVEYVNARLVSPVEEGTSSESAKGFGQAPALGKVAYRDLWDGVAVVYEKTPSALVKSTYYIEPGEAGTSRPVDEIRLRYNLPVKVDRSGDLVMSFATGEMRERRPVAWQEISGTKTAVDAEYRLLGEREVGFKVEAYDPRYPLVIDPELNWNTFLGGSEFDEGYGIAVDMNGNCYVTGYSYSSWGSPVRPFAGGQGYSDAFVAKLDTDGALEWNTFLGASGSGGLGYDFGYAIAVDTSGNSYVTGKSDATWGSPVRPFSSWTNYTDVFVAKLDANGALQWNTFLGGYNFEEGHGIAVDISGNSYVTGFNYGTWDLPLRPYGGGYTDVFVAKLNANGVKQWNTNLGGPESGGNYGLDSGWGIAVDASANCYIIGFSETTWGNPVRDFSGEYYRDDAFVAKLDTDGALQWNTFLGGSSDDSGYGIAVDTNGNSYLAGWSETTWGSPVRTFAGPSDAFAAKLDTNGVLQWNTFLGASGSGGMGYDGGYAIAVDTNGNCYVTGYSYSSWGSPVRPFAGVDDAFVAKLDTNGALQWNTFLGGLEVDYGKSIAVDTSWNSYATGSSDATWGSPILPHMGYGKPDAFVAKIPANPFAIPPEITSLSPSGATACDPGFQLSVVGSGFQDGAVVRWDGSDRPTTFVNSSKLEATIAGSDLTSGKTIRVAVRNPDLGLSDAANFSVSNFTIGSSTSSVSVTAGQSATYTIQVTPQLGPYNASVSFSCSGLPSKCTPSFSPINVTPGADVATTTLTLTTQASSSSAVGAAYSSTAFLPPTTGLPLSILVLLIWFSFRRAILKNSFRRWLAAGALLCLIVLLASCSAGGGGNDHPPYTGTPKGTHQITVQGNSSCLTASTTVTLVVR